jgi:hypothetical protein
MLDLRKNRRAKAGVIGAALASFAGMLGLIHAQQALSSSGGDGAGTESAMGAPAVSATTAAAAPATTPTSGGVTARASTAVVVPTATPTAMSAASVTTNTRTRVS